MYQNIAKKKRRRTFSALVAVVIAFTLTLTAFDAATLRSAFADDKASAASVVQKEGAADEKADDGPDDTALPPEGEGEPTRGEGGDAENDRAQGDSDEPVEGAAARAGPAAKRLESTTEAIVENTVGNASELKVENVAEAASEILSCTVTFYSDSIANGASILARKIASAEAGSRATVVVSDVSASAPSARQVFRGWSHEGPVATTAIEVDPAAGDISLFPVFESGHWLRFSTGDAGMSATSVAKCCVASRRCF